ncbi:unnamed protein product [Symbiodinium sp. CCMP2456]|nr:unnamed protein product [Symbiodinium sp. CCMP2456]
MRALLRLLATVTVLRCFVPGGRAFAGWRSAPQRHLTQKVRGMAEGGEKSSPVRLLFDNDRIRVSDFRLAPGDSFCARHDLPTVRWQVDPGRADRGAGAEDDADKKVFFVEAGKEWQLKNIGESVYRQVIFEIKQPAKHTEEQVRDLLARATYSTNVGSELLFENHLCRVWDFWLPPGGGSFEDVHHHVLDYAFVYVAPGRLLGSFHDGKPGLFDSVNKDGDVTWSYIPDTAPEDVKFAHGGKNGYDDQPMREYLIELK